jgi:hypothetical protein
MNPFSIKMMHLIETWDIFDVVKWESESEGCFRFYIIMGDLLGKKHERIEVTEDNIELLHKACQDCYFAGDNNCTYGPDLFICRQFKTRPIRYRNKTYPRSPRYRNVSVLFDEAAI